MKQPVDTKTPDLLPEHDLAGERQRKPTAKELAAARMARFREKHGVKPMTLNLPLSVHDAFNAYIAARNAKLPADKQLTKNGVIVKLIETQLLRVR